MAAGVEDVVDSILSKVSLRSRPRLQVSRRGSHFVLHPQPELANDLRGSDVVESV